MCGRLIAGRLPAACTFPPAPSLFTAAGGSQIMGHQWAPEAAFSPTVKQLPLEDVCRNGVGQAPCRFLYREPRQHCRSQVSLCCSVTCKQKQGDGTVQQTPHRGSPKIPAKQADANTHKRYTSPQSAWKGQTGQTGDLCRARLWVSCSGCGPSWRSEAEASRLGGGSNKRCFLFPVESAQLSQRCSDRSYLQK